MQSGQDCMTKIIEQIICMQISLLDQMTHEELSTRVLTLGLWSNEEEMDALYNKYKGMYEIFKRGVFFQEYLEIHGKELVKGNGIGNSNEEKINQ